MSHFDRHQEFYDKSIYLTDEERKAPVSVLATFFSEYPLHGIREVHRDTPEACLSTNIAPFEDAGRRAALILYNHRVLRMVEAATLLATQSSPESLSPSHTGIAPEEAIISVLDMQDLQNRVMDLQQEVFDLGDPIHQTWSKQSSGESMPLDLKNLLSKLLTVEHNVTKLTSTIIACSSKIYGSLLEP
jgi:hypothetical protein